jgi:hypothetical protein
LDFLVWRRGTRGGGQQRIVLNVSLGGDNNDGSTSDNNDNDNDNNAKKKKTTTSSDLSWLRNAIDTPSPLEPDGVVFVESKQGISGFAVDPQRGFVVVLVGNKDRATYAVISPKDKKQVRSAEALCLVQLAGGLDLGTPVLPPETLAKLVAEEMDMDDPAAAARELRQQVKLRRVDVVAYQGQGQDGNNKKEFEPTVGGASLTATTRPTSSSPERNAAIQEQVVKLTAAVKKLPQLEECTKEQIQVALQIYADDNGGVDRPRFTALLDYLRRQINAMETPKVQFNLLVNVKGEQEDLMITAPSPVIGVGLALRYKVNVVVSEECEIDGFDVVEIASRFPAFRPLKELEQDARNMDRFIPSTMFGRTTAPDNDDKM